MSSPFVGEIKMFGGNFTVRGFAQCNGQLMEIRQNTALFALLGNTFGGDGRVTFALPDLRGRTPLHYGQGAGLSHYSLGETGGQENVTLLSSQLPGHTHTAQGDTAGGAIGTPVAGAVWSSVPRGHPAAYSNSSPNTTMASIGVAAAGGSQSHNNRSPYLAVTFIIALQGIFPSRS